MKPIWMPVNAYGKLANSRPHTHPYQAYNPDGGFEREFAHGKNLADLDDDVSKKEQLHFPEGKVSRVKCHGAYSTNAPSANCCFLTLRAQKQEDARRNRDTT